LTLPIDFSFATIAKHPKIDWNNLKPNSFVQLPNIPSLALPKAMEQTDINNFLLTEFRVSILQRAVDFANGKQILAHGFIPVGIQGSGKSQLVYAIACMAYEMKCPLLYVVRPKTSCMTIVSLLIRFGILADWAGIGSACHLGTILYHVDRSL